MKKRSRSAPATQVDFGTTEEWIQDLQDLFNETSDSGTDGFLSAAELARNTGKGKEKVLQALREFQSQGRLEIKNRIDLNLAGRRQQTPVYRVLKSPS